MIAFLRTSLTYAELAAGFGISPATCWREVAEGVSVLADRGRRISLKDVARLAVKMGWDYLIVDGVHVPAVTFGRKTGGQRAFYSGKHKRHGLNVQTVCSPAGELLRAAAPAPGATVDVTAARKAGIAGMLTSVIGVLADLGYLGWDEAVITGRRKPRGTELTAAQRAANRLQAQLRCVGERGNARLKYWKVLATELRCRPQRCTAVVKAVLALHYMECATRRTAISPAERAKTGGGVFGSDGRLVIRKDSGENSMPENRRSRPGIRSGAPGDPRDKVKAALPESQSPEGVKCRLPEMTPVTGTGPCRRMFHGLRQSSGTRERCPVRALKEANGTPKSR